ncbi:MAG: hypothetical protein QGG01_06340, partial [Roseibacillus sp.]|nr:hypothetical protein [Roseibacillus sp.]
MRRLLPLLSPSVLLLASCALQEDGQHPARETAIDLPSLWSEASSGQHGKISTGWLSEFQDRRMNSLVREAVRKNNNLQASAHRLRATRESTITARAARLPRI